MTCFVCLYVVLCSGQVDAADGARNTALDQKTLRIKFRSVNEIKKLLPVGTSTNEIIARIGQPGGVLTNPGNMGDSWLYDLRPFPADDDMRGTYVVGFDLSITNGFLAFCGLIYTKPSPEIRSQRAIPFDTNSNLRQPAFLKLFLVSTSSVPNGKLIDTEKFPNLGYISATPTLTVRKLRDVTLTEEIERDPRNGNFMNWNFAWQFPDDQTNSFRMITATNLGRILLLTIDDKPVIAPRIIGPIEAGRVSVSFGNRAEMEELRRQLSRIQRE